MRYVARLISHRPARRSDDPVGWIEEAEQRYLRKLGYTGAEPKRPDEVSRVKVKRAARGAPAGPFRLH